MHGYFCNIVIKYDPNNWCFKFTGKRNYKPYVLLLLGANLRLINIFVLSLAYIILNAQEMSKSASVVHIMCIVYILATLIAFIVVGNLTFLHVKLVTKCSTTKEHNTYTYSRIGGNPLKNSRLQNWINALCSPQYPSYRPATTLYVKVPDAQKLPDETKPNLRQAFESKARRVVVAVLPRLCR